MPLTTLAETDYFPNNRARVVVNRQLRQSPMERHRHEFKELVVVLSGSGLHNLDGRRHRIQRGDVLFIDERASHGYEETDQLNLANILINRESLIRMEPDLAELPGYPFLIARRSGSANSPFNWIHLTKPELEQVSEWIDRMEREASTETGAGYMIAEAYLKLIFAIVLRQMQESRLPDKKKTGLDQTLSWVEAHLAEELTVPRLARRAGLSERSLFRQFKHRFGISPAAYIRQARLQKAASLLKQSPALSCREIAARCGFRDANYFSTAFKQAFGNTPRSSQQAQSKLKGWRTRT